MPPLHTIGYYLLSHAFNQPLSFQHSPGKEMFAKQKKNQIKMSLVTLLLNQKVANKFILYHRF